MESNYLNLVFVYIFSSARKPLTLILGDSMSKCIIPLEKVGSGGIHTRSEELITDEVVGLLESVNSNGSPIGGKDDPFYKEYNKFLTAYNSASSVISKDDFDIASSDDYFDEIDFNSTVEAPVTLTSEHFHHNPLWAQGEFNSTVICETSMHDPFDSETFTGGKSEGVEMTFYKNDFIYDPADMAFGPAMKFVK